MNEMETVAEKSLNIKLVNTLIQVIRSLSPEERKILEQELFFDHSETSNPDIIKISEAEMVSTLTPEMQITFPEGFQTNHEVAQELKDLAANLLG